MNLFLYNNNIKIIATFYNNNIIEKQDNLIKIRINVETNLDKIIEFIKKYKPNIYYFATPKIDINSKSKKDYIVYEIFYINYPLRILSYEENLTHVHIRLVSIISHRKL